MKLLIVGVAAALAAGAQVADKANAGYRTAEGRARVAQNLNDPHRDERQRPDRLVESLKIAPGTTVADLGTGVGYLLPYLSRAVGDKGQVIGQDIFLDFLEQARERAAKDKLSNVRFVTGSAKDPKLPGGAADLVLTLDAYHHFDFPAEMLAGVKRGLKAGGRFALIDFYKRPGAMPNGDAVSHIRIDKDEVIREVEANGFRLESQFEHIPASQYVLLFRVR